MAIITPVGLPLFVMAEEVSSLTGELPLFMHASSNSGVFCGADIYLECASGVGDQLSSNIPITLLGSDIGSISGSIPLSVEGSNNTASANADIFLFNEQTVLSSGVDLFVQGQGTTDDTLPLSSSLYLFLQRNASNALPIYLHGPGTSGTPTSTTLYINGATTLSSGVPISIADTVGHKEKAATLYTHGF